MIDRNCGVVLCEISQNKGIIKHDDIDLQIPNMDKRNHQLQNLWFKQQIIRCIHYLVIKLNNMLRINWRRWDLTLIWTMRTMPSFKGMFMEQENVHFRTFSLPSFNRELFLHSILGHRLSPTCGMDRDHKLNGFVPTCGTSKSQWQGFIIIHPVFTWPFSIFSGYSPHYETNQIIHRHGILWLSLSGGMRRDFRITTTVDGCEILHQLIGALSHYL